MRGTERQIDLDFLTTKTMVSETIEINTKTRNDLLFDLIGLGLLRAELSACLNQNGISPGVIKELRKIFQAEELEIEKNKAMLTFFVTESFPNR